MVCGKFLLLCFGTAADLFLDEPPTLARSLELVCRSLELPLACTYTEYPVKNDFSSLSVVAYARFPMYKRRLSAAAAMTASFSAAKTWHFGALDPDAHQS